MNDLLEEFVEGFRHFRPMYDEILNGNNMAMLDEIYEAWTSNKEKEFDAELWSRYSTTSPTPTSSGRGTSGGS